MAVKHLRKRLKLAMTTSQGSGLSRFEHGNCTRVSYHTRHRTFHPLNSKSNTNCQISNRKIYLKTKMKCGPQAEMQLFLPSVQKPRYLHIVNIIKQAFDLWLHAHSNTHVYIVHCGTLRMNMYEQQWTLTRSFKKHSVECPWVALLNTECTTLNPADAKLFLAKCTMHLTTVKTDIRGGA